MLRASLLGPARVEAGEPPGPVDLATHKGAAVLYYLASRPDEPVARTRLIALLWQDSDEPEGRNNLSTALSRLRRGLPSAPIVAAADTLVWRADANAWTDLHDFRQLTRPGATRDELSAGVALLRGPFLEGFDLRDCPDWEDWLSLERAAWQQLGLDALERVAEADAAARDWPAALGHARRALTIDPLQERFHRQVMRFCEQSGDRAAALAHYRLAAQRLLDELGVEPDPETQKLCASILNEPSRSVTAEPARVERPPQPQPGIPLVGRHAELAALDAAAQDAAQGRGRLVVLQGEVGIGKSRLVEELLWRLDGAPARELASGPRWTVLVGACHESEQGLAYHPFVDVLTGALDTSEAPPLSDVWLAEVARLVPDLLERRPDLPTPSRLDPQQEQRRLFEGVARFLAALPPPRLLILEDLHWADESSLALLGHLVRHVALSSTLVVGSIRSGEVEPRLASLLRHLEREHHLQSIELSRLSAEAIVQLLREVVREDVRSLGKELHVETEGNPLFAVETIRALLESGQLQLRGTAELPRPVLPDSIQSAIRARLARLDAAAQGLANSVAVLGGAVDFDQARRVASLDEEQALDALERLVSTQLLRELPGPVYVFGHDKIRQVVYDDLSGARRRVLHRRALESLTSEGAIAAPLERLAYHAIRAQEWEQAVGWSEAAANAALGVFAYGPAAALYEQALDSLDRLPSEPERRVKNVTLRLRLAQVGLYVYPSRLAELLRQAEAAASALGDRALLARVWLAQGSALYIQGRFAEALPVFEQLQPLVAASSDRALRVTYANTLGQLLALRGEYARAIPLLEEAIELLSTQPGIQATVATHMLAATHAYAGDFDTASRLLKQSQAHPESGHDQAALAASLTFFLEAVHQMRGDWEAARSCGRQAIATAHEANDVIHEFIGHLMLGLPLAHLGDVDGGAASLEQAISIARRADTVLLLGRAYGWLAEVELLRNRPAEALRAAETGAELARAHGYRFDAALCERALGLARLALDEDGAEAAQRHLWSALEQFESIGARPEIARTRLALAQYASRRGQPAVARAQAAEAAESFHALGMAEPPLPLGEV
jgi:DNA-binding SARP family transcriptional activator/tetratricopeptide (TPR) repeat protein